MTSHGQAVAPRRKLLPLTFTAIGVVYGDIGTSPLYTIRECFFGAHAVAPIYENVLGVLSLILYALIIVVSVKYIAIVMMEGLKVATPLFGPCVRPLSVIIIIGIFVIQKFGTHRVGGLFGPVMVVWFLTISALGLI